LKKLRQRAPSDTLAVWTIVPVARPGGRSRPLTFTVITALGPFANRTTALATREKVPSTRTRIARMVKPLLVNSPLGNPRM
jgi:hypothetical protein